MIENHGGSYELPLTGGKTMYSILNKSVLCFLVLMLVCASSVQAGSKPSPDETIALLKAGNTRFVAGTSQHPHTDAARLVQAGKENQGDHAYATVITCSDSRVPVERVFDAGVMDLFIIRVAGNVCDTDEVGSIEYGLAHVNTPVLVVLGHTQCGAVTAVTHAVHGTGHALERNIPPLVDNIQPAVERAMHAHQDVHGDAIIPYAIKENVWQGIEDLYLTSPSTRELVKSGKVKVVGAIYDVGTGKIEWLPEAPSLQILAKVLNNPARALNAMADNSHGSSEAQDSHAQAASHEAPVHASAAPSHNSGHGTESVQAASHEAPAHGSAAPSHGAQHAAVQVHAQDVTLIEASKLKSLDDARHRKINANYAGAAATSEGLSFIWKLAGLGLAIAVLLGLAWQAGVFQRMGIAGKLYAGFGAVVLIAVMTGVGGYYFLGQVNAEAHMEAVALELDLMAGETAATMNEFLLYGIEDKARGEESVKKVNELLAEYKTDFEDIKKLHLSAAEEEVLRDIERPIGEFTTVFTEVTEKFHEIETYKETLDELGQKVTTAIEEALHRHETELEEMEASGADLSEIIIQTELVKFLSQCEVAELKLSHAEVEFLLDKKTDRIAHMEHELGLFYGTLEAVKELVPLAATNKAEEAKDLAMVEAVHEEMVEFQRELARVVEDELIVAADAIKAAELIQTVEAATELMASNAQHHMEAAKHEANTASVVLIGLCITLGSVLSFTIVRGITKPVNRIIADLTEGAEQVASASGQVSSASQSLAEGATEQAAGLEETSSSLEEMSSMTKQNADNAQQANTLASDASKAANNGGEAMGRMSAAIADIQKSSDETAKIIKVIDEIAFQTNLLALNAAVEAARAGEAGKGFAVVAEEVRNLAMRSAEAAKNTSSLIEESVKNSNNGVDIAGEVSKVLDEIVGSVSKTTDLVGEIAAASQEQAQGIDQVNTAVSQMDKVTQQNAANAEESASASEELSAQAESMNQAVQELVGLVGGHTGQSHGNLTAGQSPVRQSRLGVTDQAFHRIANSTVKKEKSKVASAHKSIPLDEEGDSEFGEF